jgi:hypothetical protein
MSTKQYHHHQDSQLFLIRVWSDKGNDGEVEWHGKLQHVVSGEAHTFHGCPQLIELLLEMAGTGAIETRARGQGYRR